MRYSPTVAAAFSRNVDPSRMWRRTIGRDLCPVCAMIVRSLAPAAAADVAKPARNECPSSARGIPVSMNKRTVHPGARLCVL